MGASFKSSRQVVPLQYLFDHLFYFCKACSDTLAWSRMATGGLPQGICLKGLESLKFLLLFVLLQDLAESCFLRLYIVLKGRD